MTSRDMPGPSRQRLAAVIARRVGCSQAAAYAAVGDLLDFIVATTQAEGRFSLPGFGSFDLAQRAARRGVNPATGAAMEIPASVSLRFRPAAELRRL